MEMVRKREVMRQRGKEVTKGNRERRWRGRAAEGDKSCEMLACVLLKVNKTLCYLLVVFEWLWKSVRKFECGPVYLAFIVVEKVKIPTRKIDVLGTQVLLLILRPGHPPTGIKLTKCG